MREHVNFLFILRDAMKLKLFVSVLHVDWVNMHCLRENVASVASSVAALNLWYLRCVAKDNTKTLKHLLQKSIVMCLRECNLKCWSKQKKKQKITQETEKNKKSSEKESLASWQAQSSILITVFNTQIFLFYFRRDECSKFSFKLVKKKKRTTKWSKIGHSFSPRIVNNSFP